MNLIPVLTQLSQILNYRNEDMLVKSNDALNKSSDAMREIALAAKAENELMSALISKSQKDSHTVKVLTCIALIYLPASLVAVRFPPPATLRGSRRGYRRRAC